MPKAAVGQSLKILDAKTRAALHQANRKIVNQDAYVDDVIEAYGAAE